jgi:predicted histidine transporter YuiF (NhaC family)
MEKIASVLIVITFFGILFGLPIWFMVSHHKKSKKQITQKQKQPKKTANELSVQKLEHNTHIGRVLGIVLGVVIGSKLLGSLLIGFILSAILGYLGDFIGKKVS